MYNRLAYLQLGMYQIFFTANSPDQFDNNKFLLWLVSADNNTICGITIIYISNWSEAGRIGMMKVVHVLINLGVINMFSLCTLVQACGRRCHTALKNCWRCGRDGGGNHLSHRCPDLNSPTIKVHLFYLETNRHRTPSPLNPPAFLWMCYYIASVKADHCQSTYSVKQIHRPGLTESCADVFNSILLSCCQRFQISL